MTCEYEDDFSDYLTVYRKEGNEELVADVIDGIGFWRDIPGISRDPVLGLVPQKTQSLVWSCVDIRHSISICLYSALQNDRPLFRKIEQDSFVYV